jgi:HK97 family phage portal protein
LKFRNAIMAMFGGIKNYVSSYWKELGKYTSYFSSFGTDIYADEVCRACIRTLAEHTSKANVKVFSYVNGERISSDKKIEKIIQNRPNVYMNGKEFLQKVRTLYEINNMVFIYIQRDELGNFAGLYPMPTATYEAVDVGSELYIKFEFLSGATTTVAWEDLAVLRKDYNTSDIFADTNEAILTSLELLTTTNEGLANAIKATSNLRGYLKTTKAGLKDDALVKLKSDFDKSFMSIDNTSGFAALDAYTEFVPVNLQPQIASYKSIEDLRTNMHRYFGTNDNIVMSKATPDERESFYESKIETWLLALSLELSNKIPSRSQKARNFEVIFESNRMAYMSMRDKLALVAMVDRGAMTPNEWRMCLNLAPIDGGDIPVRRLDTAPTTQTAESVDDKEDDTDDKQ